MKTVKALMAVVAIAGVLGLAGIATAATFNVEVQVGWINSTGACAEGPPDCLGFLGTGGNGAGLFAGTSTRLNWDNGTQGIDSYLSIGALPDVNGFPPAVPVNPAAPIGIGTTTITSGGPAVTTAQIRHTNNAIDANDDFLGSITVRTLLRITAADDTPLIDENSGGLLDVPVTFLETNNSEPCDETSNSLGSICDDQFTFVGLNADIPLSFGGENFILHVRGLLPANTCEDAGGGIVNCLTREGEINDRFVQISLEQIDIVPLPGTLLLLGIGMLGMGAALRKRS
jgi:hypothetical protein